MAEVEAAEASKVPSQTIYLSNLNEKVRKEGTVIGFISPSLSLPLSLSNRF